MPTPDEDYHIARDELLAGNYGHAARHIAGALSADPLRREWLVCLDQIVEATAAPTELIPGGPGTWFGEAAVRARILWTCGKPDEALGLIVQVAGVAPESRYLAWAAEWASKSAAGLERDFVIKIANTLAGGFLKSLVSLPTPLPVTHPLRATREDALTVAEALDRAHPAPDIVGLRSQLLRRLGRIDEAIETARQAAQSASSSNNEIRLALALRDGGQYDEALHAYARALAHEPRNASVHLDMGDLLLDLERWEDAEAHYSAARTIDPRNEWAEPSLLYARLRAGPPTGLVGKLLRSRDPTAWRARLEKLAPTNDRAAWALSELEAPLVYVNWLPEPADAVVNAFRETLATLPRDPIVTTTSSALEAPSAVLAVRVAQGSPLAVKTTSIQQPDPRLPSHPVRWLLWRYEGTDALPNLPPPPPPALSEVEMLANTAFRLGRWARGPVRAEVADLLATMVHPPTPPTRAEAPNWILRAQVAAACLVARSDWRVLLDVLAGPMDWTVGAAAVVLGQIAQTESSKEIAAAFEARLRSAPRSGYCPYLHALICSWLRLPGLSADERSRLEAVRRELEAN